MLKVCEDIRQHQPERGALGHGEVGEGSLFTGAVRILYQGLQGQPRGGYSDQAAGVLLLYSFSQLSILHSCITVEGKDE